MKWLPPSLLASSASILQTKTFPWSLGYLGKIRIIIFLMLVRFLLLCGWTTRVLGLPLNWPVGYSLHAPSYFSLCLGLLLRLGSIIMLHFYSLPNSLGTSPPRVFSPPNQCRCPLDVLEPKLILYRWKCSLKKSVCEVSVGSLPVYVAPIPSRIKREDSFTFSLKAGAAERDIEKGISYSSPTLPRYSAGDSDLSPTTTSYSELTGNSSSGDADIASTYSRPQSAEVLDVLSDSQPFVPPTILPIGARDARTSRSLDGGISLAIQTKYGIAL